MSANNIVSFPSESYTTDQWFDTTSAPTFYPYSYPYYGYAAPTDKVIELKAWLSGYLDSRNLSEKSLKRIQQKLNEFYNEP